MLLREIYKSALRLLAESTSEGDNADYEERAPYILATFCNQAQGVDISLRRFLKLSATAAIDAVYLSLDSEFPLLPRLATCAALYLAAMLVIENDSELSDSLYEKYCDTMSSIYDSVGSLSESVTDVYFGN